MSRNKLVKFVKNSQRYYLDVLVLKIRICCGDFLVIMKLAFVRNLQALENYQITCSILEIVYLLLPGFMFFFSVLFVAPKCSTIFMSCI